MCPRPRPTTRSSGNSLHALLLPNRRDSSSYSTSLSWGTSDLRNFHVATDHKPLTFVLSTASDKYTPRQIRHLDYVAQFTTDIRHVAGLHNPIADALSRNAVYTLHSAQPPSIDLQALADAQTGDPELRALQNSSTTSLRLQSLPLPASTSTIICDTSNGTPRPFVPSSLRRTVFNALHSLSHPGVQATQQLIKERYVWPGMKKDIKAWTRTCQPCRWPEAFPMPDMTAETVALTFASGWIARFGVPSTLSTDRGGQFESRLWASLLQLLGCKHLRTTAYHPIANGIIERFHRQLKAALKAHMSSSHWTEILPLVLLGIRTSLKTDLQCSAAELVYGTTLRVPGEFFLQDTSSTTEETSALLTNLKTAMRKLQAVPPRYQPRNNTYTNKELFTCTHVFVRTDAIRKPLQPTYAGPFRVIDRAAKYFTIDLNGRNDKVSLDRLKPAHLDTTPQLDSDATPMTTPSSSSTTAPARTTRSGRRVHFPNKLMGIVP